MSFRVQGGNQPRGFILVPNNDSSSRQVLVDEQQVRARENLNERGLCLAVPVIRAKAKRGSHKPLRDKTAATSKSYELGSLPGRTLEDRRYYPPLPLWIQGSRKSGRCRRTLAGPIWVAGRLNAGLTTSSSGPKRPVIVATGGVVPVLSQAGSVTSKVLLPAIIQWDDGASRVRRDPWPTGRGVISPAIPEKRDGRGNGCPGC